MAEVKSHEFDGFLQRNWRSESIFLVYGPDRGLVSERAAQIARKTGIKLDDPFAVTKLEASELQANSGQLIDEMNSIGLFGGDKLVWVRGMPRLFNSSSLATRGFCNDCGTPLTFGYHESMFTYLTVGSLDHPEMVMPERHYGIESAIPWLHIADDLPRETTPDDPRYAAMVVHQHPLPVD